MKRKKKTSEKMTVERVQKLRADYSTAMTFTKSEAQQVLMQSVKENPELKKKVEKEAASLNALGMNRKRRRKLVREKKYLKPFVTTTSNADNLKAIAESQAKVDEKYGKREEKK